MRGCVVVRLRAAPAAAPRRMREVLRIIREPFRRRWLPTMGWGRRVSRLCETRRKAPAVLSWLPAQRAPGCRHGQPLFGTAETVGSAVFLDSHAVDRQRQATLGGREGDGRRQPARIVEG